MLAECTFSRFLWVLFTTLNPQNNDFEGVETTVKHTQHHYMAFYVKSS